MKSSEESAYLSPRLRMRTCLTWTRWTLYIPHTSLRPRLRPLSLVILEASLVCIWQEPSIVVCKINYPDK